jgi:pimeloyl-ACP methyl ester carboxylesterase
LPDSITAAPRPRSYYTEPERVDVGGLGVAYRRKGEGEATLYLHGAGLTRMWLPFHERLAQTVDLIAPEHPGFGDTEMPEWLDGFDDLVLHYDELLDALGLRQVHLVGYSLGGWVAAEFAVVYQAWLKSLTLITPAGLCIPGRPIENIYAMSPERLWELIFTDPAAAAHLMPDFESLDEVVHQYGESTALARLAWNPQYDLKLERRLGRVHCPTLVVRAEHDRLVPDEMAQRYAELIPDARIETVPGSGHGMVVEQADATADLIAGFISEVSA